MSGQHDHVLCDACVDREIETARLREAAGTARDLTANYLWNEDDSGDEGDIEAAYDALAAILGPSTEESLGATLAALDAK